MLAVTDAPRPSPSAASPADGYAIRAARADDVARLGAVEVAAGELFRTVGMDDVAGDEGWPVDQLEAARRDGRVWVAVATATDRPVGYALALVLDGQHHLEQLSVDPAHGRRGLGAALVGAVVAWARAAGAADLTLSTFRDVAWNRPYYEALGFRVVDPADRSPVLQDVVAHEARLGLDTTVRVVMRRPITDPGAS